MSEYLNKRRSVKSFDPEVKTVIVSELPPCQICEREGVEEPAEYDAKIPGGPWGNLCEKHFIAFGCRLGLGFGQKLVVRGSVKQPEEVLSAADKLCQQCGKGCAEGSWNKETGRMRILGNKAKIQLMLATGLYCEEI